MASTRNTSSFKLIWNTFNSSKNALSVVHLVQQHTDTMNKTTVYRILDRLEKEGKLHTFLGKNGLKFYAKCHSCTAESHTDVHPHFQCDSCGIVECLDVSVQIPKIEKHKVNRASMLLLGECVKCLV